MKHWKKVENKKKKGHEENVAVPGINQDNPKLTNCFDEVR
jgi:hypothetical protein